MKKILILGGAYQHKKMVLAAQKMGIITYVTDYNPVDRSPAKQIADRALALDVMAVDEIVDFCRREGIQGVIGPYLDPIRIRPSSSPLVRGWVSAQSRRTRCRRK